jgi:FkbM family methyltransferase
VITVRVINRLLKPFRYRCVPLTNFTLAIEHLTRAGKKVTFLQVGANDGVRFDSLFFTVTSQRWRGVVVEPLPNVFERLVSNYQDHEQVKPVNFAVHPSEKTATIFSVRPHSLRKYPDYVAGMASFLKSHLISGGIEEEDIVRTEVECTTVTKLVLEHNLQDLDILQIDTEGFDLEVLRSIDFEVVKPLVIKFEWMNLSSSQKEQPIGLLKQQGYHTVVERDAVDCCALLNKNML